MPVSDSEKHQGHILGCRFSDKAEHVPIKKRRFFFRSPSPPPENPSSDNEENSNSSKNQVDLFQSAAIHPATPKAELGKMSVYRRDVQCNYPKKVNEKLESCEDFSGISILAAAACSSSLGREFGYAEDGSGVEEPSIHEGPVEVSTNNEAQSFSKGLARDDFVNISDISIGGASSCVTTALVGELAAMSTVECASETAKNVEKSIRGVVGSPELHPRDDRLHWDLNVVMDAWEQPFDCQGAHTSDLISQSSGLAIRCDANRKSAEACHLLSEPESSKCDDKMTLLSCEPRKLGYQISQGNTEVIDDCNHENHLVSMCQKSISSDCGKVPNSLVHDNNSVQPSPLSYVHENPPFLKPLYVKRNFHSEPIESMNSDVAASLFTDLKNLSGHSVSDTSCSVVSLDAVVTKSTSVSADSQVSLTVMPTLDIQNKDTSKLELSEKPFDDKWHCLKDDVSDAQMHMALPVNNDVSLKKVDKEIDDPQRSNSLHKFVVTSDAKANDDDFSMNASEQGETDVHVSIKEVTMASAEHLEQKFISYAPSDPCSDHGIEAEGEHQDDYDSQYEDGELREPIGEVWEEYDAFDEQAEPIDQGAENNKYSAGAADLCVPESGHVGKTNHRDAANGDIVSSVDGASDELSIESERPIPDDRDCGRDNDILKSINSGDKKMKSPASDELHKSNKISSATVVRVGDDSDGKRSIYHHTTRSTDSEGTDTRVGSRPYRRGLLSRIECPVRHDMSLRENAGGNRWGRGSGYVNSSGRVRYSMQSQPRVRQVNNWDGSSDGRRGIKRNYSPTYRSLVKPDDDDDDATTKEDRDGALNAVSYSSNPSTDDGSIADGNAAGDFHAGPKLDYDPGSNNRLKNRGRFLRYGPRMDHRAGRGRYHGSSPDDTFQSSFKYRHPLSRRDRSVSPNERRGYPFTHHSQGRSPSRSRTRSPNPKLSPRGRYGAGNCGGVYLRHRSRSPNFRSEPRMLRMRSPPHGQPGFGTDHMTGFRSFQRDHGSPPSSRWISGRKDEVGHFSYKQRPILDRSPRRIRIRGDTENLLDSAQNPKPDVYYRPNTGRFTEMDVTGSGRALRLEETYENRRRQFGYAHSARRRYESVITKRLHHDDEDDDGFVSTNRDVAEFHGRGMRGIDSRNEDIRRRFRGGGTFMYKQDGKFNSNSKSFGFDGMDSSRNLKLGESYRSFNPGRLDEMNGAGRGRRYVDSYDGRRRYYAAVHLPRRGEMEGIGRRLGHDVDDNLPVIQSSCNDDATDSHGRNARGNAGCMDDLSRRQRNEQHLDFSGQEKKFSDTSKSTDVQVPAESESAKVNSPS